MTLNRQIRAFGIYLVVCSVCQVGLYVSSSGMGSIYDPCVAFFLLGDRAAGLVWALAIWVLCLGLFILSGTAKPLFFVFMYLLSACVLALPSFAWLVFSLVGGMGHLTLGGAALVQFVGVFLVFTAVPVMFGMHLLRKGHRESAW
jgi:hypothetical protein